MKYLLWGKFFSPTSFSNVMLHLAYYLKKRGHSITMICTDLITEPHDVLIKRYMPHFEDASEVLKGCFPVNNWVEKDNKFDSAVYFLVDPILNKRRSEIKADKHIFYTVCSNDNYPLDWAKALNQFDIIWTPSNANANAIKNTGLCEKPIFVVPHGYEPSVFKPIKNNNKNFVIGMCNSICNFKGADIVLKAFFEAFDTQDKVELVLQSTATNSYTEGSKHGQYYTEYINILNQYPHKQLKTFYYEKDCNIIQMAEFYNKCNLVVNPHRGDGFGMIPLESLACDVPVIVSEYHGPLDYITREYPFWVCGEMSWTNKTSGRHHLPEYANDHEVYKYFEPNKDHVRDLMIEAYKDWMRKSKLDCKQYFKGWTWEMVTDLIERLTNGKNI